MPTKLRFGAGRVKEIGEIVSSYGKCCLLVTGPDIKPLENIYSKVISILLDQNIEVIHFSGVVPNPTIESINEAMSLASSNTIDCVLGLGGGSAIDTAKIIALTYSEKGEIDWDYIFKTFTNPFTNYSSFPESLPLIAVTTTSGTGSHVTQAAVVTNSETDEKLTIFHPANFPLVSIVDPELTITMPERGTAATGFDVFAHAFESYLGTRTSPITKSMSLKAIKTVFECLPQLLGDLKNIELRLKLAWADTLAGICLANGGASTPHPLSEIIGGICPRISHGECLALVYPGFLKHEIIYSNEKLASVNSYLFKEEFASDDSAAINFYNEMQGFIKEIKLWNSLKDYKVTEDEFSKIIENPILGHLPFASKDTLQEILKESYTRK